MKYRYSLLLIAALLLIAGSAAAGTPNVRYNDIRALGMGGAGMFMFDDFSALMYNPAQLARTETHLDLINIQANLGKDIVDMFNVWQDNKDVIENWDDTTVAAQTKVWDDLTPFDDNWMGMGAYPQIGLSLHHFAVGVYGAANVEFKSDKGIMIEPRAYMKGVVDYVFSGGAAIELPSTLLPNKLYCGAALKIIRRYQAEQMRLGADDVDIGDSFDTLVEESKHGFGVDAGFLYELLPGRVDVGMKITDLVGSIDGEAPPMIFNVGGKMNLGNRLKLEADFNDLFFNRGENMFNKLHFGAEFRPIPILPLRAGVGQGYPSVGAGLDFRALSIDAAIYGVEFSDNPGGDGDYSYALRLKLGM